MMSFWFLLTGKIEKKNVIFLLNWTEKNPFSKEGIPYAAHLSAKTGVFPLLLTDNPRTSAMSLVFR